MDKVKHIVIGAGVVGLSIAAKLAQKGEAVILLERSNQIGSGVSSRNSGVIHAGLYYPKNSLKAQHCVRGKEQLYNYCASRHIPHQRLGKLLVASKQDAPESLMQIKETALENGVDDLYFLSQRQINAMEPDLSVEEALFSPSTGIIDVHSLMESLSGDIEDHGGVIALNCHIAHIKKQANGFIIGLMDGGALYEIMTQNLINAAGMGAVDLAQNMDFYPSKYLPRNQFVKGNYFQLTKKSPFRHLIYPIPAKVGAEKGGLGVHVTLDLQGRARFGPDVEWLSNTDFDYIPNAARAIKFVQKIGLYYPNITQNDLSPDYAGIRPKIIWPEIDPNNPAGDFAIIGEEQHQITGLVQLFGIESPGLTAALSIADHVIIYLPI